MTTHAELLDQELLLNRILDKYAEAMRERMPPQIRERFDALTPDQRRWLAEKKINEVIEE